MIKVALIFIALSAGVLLWRTIGATSLDNALTFALGMAMAFVAGLLYAADKVR